MLQILLIEDNPADVDYTCAALEGWNVPHRVETVHNGEDGLDRLLRGPLPDLVLLDLNLPRLSGAEILCRVREHEPARDLRVIVLATSDAERDVIESQRLTADGYITKPLSVEELSFHYYRLLSSR